MLHYTKVRLKFQILIIDLCISSEKIDPDLHGHSHVPQNILSLWINSRIVSSEQA